MRRHPGRGATASTARVQSAWANAALFDISPCRVSFGGRMVIRTGALPRGGNSAVDRSSRQREFFTSGGAPARFSRRGRAAFCAPSGDLRRARSRHQQLSSPGRPAGPRRRTGVGRAFSHCRRLFPNRAAWRRLEPDRPAVGAGDPAHHRRAPRLPRQNGVSGGDARAPDRDRGVPRGGERRRIHRARSRTHGPGA